MHLEEVKEEVKEEEEDVVAANPSKQSKYCMLRLKIMQCIPGKDRATINLRVFVISISLFPSLLSIPSYDMDQWGQYL